MHRSIGTLSIALSSIRVRNQFRQNRIELKPGDVLTVLEGVCSRRLACAWWADKDDEVGFRIGMMVFAPFASFKRTFRAALGRSEGAIETMVKAGEPLNI